MKGRFKQCNQISRKDTPDGLRCCCLVHLSLPFCLCHLAPSYKYVMMFNAGVKKRFVWLCITALFRTLLDRGGLWGQFLHGLPHAETLWFLFSCLLLILIYTLIAQKAELGARNLLNVCASWLQRLREHPFKNYSAFENITIHFPNPLYATVPLYFPPAPILWKNLPHRYAMTHFWAPLLLVSLLARAILRSRGPRWQERIVRGIAIDPNAYAYIWQSQLDRSPN